MKLHRFRDNPIIRPHMDDRMGSNINGPSLIRVPDWVPNPLGRYYLYFAHHQGTYIRLAYSDRLEGPWQVHGAGALDLADAFASAHIASPDVHVLDDRQEIRMYYHACCRPTPPHQVTRLAESPDGLNFRVRPEILGSSYWRAFWWRDAWVTLEMPGVFRKSPTGISDWIEGPTLFSPDMRHAAVQLSGDELRVFYSNVGDVPERILWTTIQLTSDWHAWEVGPTQTLAAPEHDFEGADCPLVASERGAVHHRAHQLRDPCIFEEDGKTYLLYSVAGEHGIAIGELLED